MSEVHSKSREHVTSVHSRGRAVHGPGRARSGDTLQFGSAICLANITWLPCMARGSSTCGHLDRLCGRAHAAFTPNHAHCGAHTHHHDPCARTIGSPGILRLRPLASASKNSKPAAVVGSVTAARNGSVQDRQHCASDRAELRERSAAPERSFIKAGWSPPSESRENHQPDAIHPQPRL